MAHSAGTPGEVFLDARGCGRALRLTWHHEADVVVLSLWRGQSCTGSFRLASADVEAFIDALVDGMRAGAPPTALPPRQRTAAPVIAPPDPDDGPFPRWYRQTDGHPRAAAS